MIVIICLIGSILCFTYVGLLLINPDKFVNLFPPYSKNEVKRKQCCWVNGEEIKIPPSIKKLEEIERDTEQEELRKK